MSVRRFFVCAAVLLLCANGARAARYQRCQDGKTLVWNNLRGVAQEATWSGLRDINGYATGEGTLTWYRLAGVVNSYAGKMFRGKFEGVVTREQAGTRLHATFANGEQVGGWAEERENETPSPSLAAKKRTAKPEESVEPEEAIEEIRSSTPKPTRTPKPSPRPTATPRPTPSTTPTPIESLTLTPTPTPRQAPTPSPTLSPLRTPTPTPMPASTAVPTATPQLTAISTPIPIPSAPQLKSEPSRAQSPGGLRLDHGLAPTRDSLDLALPPPSPRSALPPSPWREPVLSLSQKPEDRKVPSATPGSTIVTALLAGSKAQMISEFKKVTTAAFARVKNATNGFREVLQMDAVRTLPPEVSGSISALAEQARDFRAKLGYEVAMYECGAETATCEALVTLDQSTQDLMGKDAPAARLKLMNFFKRYTTPNRDDQLALWRYLGSILASCNQARKDAETHLERAKSLESAGKKEEALWEYQQIYRIYPNSITADKIRTLQEQPQ